MKEIYRWNIYTDEITKLITIEIKYPDEISTVITSEIKYTDEIWIELYIFSDQDISHEI